MHIDLDGIRIYDIAGAAEYTGLTESSIKYHMYSVKDLTYHLLGRNVLFTQDQLDRFLEIKRSPGRPSKQENSNVNDL